MIQNDQFTNLPDDLIVMFSSKEDGSMLDKNSDLHNPEQLANRQAFCHKAGIKYEEVVYQRVVYDERSTYALIAEVDSRSLSAYNQHTLADGLFTRERGVGLFLPVADCIATVIYDPKQSSLAMLHLGRHSTLSNLLDRTLHKFVQEGSRATDLRVWMSPALSSASNQLEYFTHEHEPEWKDFFTKQNDKYYVDFQGHNFQKCVSFGVAAENITISPVDTATDTGYFSHSRGDTADRFACIAMMKKS